MSPVLAAHETARLHQAGTTAPSRALNLKLAALQRCRWRPLPKGEGLEALDRSGRVVGVLYFEEGVDYELAALDAVAPGGDYSAPAGGAAGPLAGGGSGATLGAAHNAPAGGPA